MPSTGLSKGRCSVSCTAFSARVPSAVPSSGSSSVVLPSACSRVLSSRSPVAGESCSSAPCGPILLWAPRACSFFALLFLDTVTPLRKEKETHYPRTSNTRKPPEHHPKQAYARRHHSHSLHHPGAALPPSPRGLILTLLACFSVVWSAWSSAPQSVPSLRVRSLSCSFGIVAGHAHRVAAPHASRNSQGVLLGSGRVTSECLRKCQRCFRVSGALPSV